MKKNLKTCVQIFIALSSVIVISAPAFAKNNQAMFIGCDYPGAANTTNMTITADGYFGERGYISGHQNIPHYEEDGIDGTNGYYLANPSYAKILESNVIYLSTHANLNGMYFKTKNKNDAKYRVCVGTAGTNGDNVIWDDPVLGFKMINLIDNYDLSGTNLIVFGGCETAKDDGNYTIARKAYAKGAKCTIGWKSTVNVIDLPNWCNHFSNGLYQGDTIKGAMDYANAFVYIVPWTAKANTFYGDANQTMDSMHSNTRAIHNDDMETPLSVSEQLIFEKEKEKEDLNYQRYLDNTIDVSDKGIHFIGKDNLERISELLEASFDTYSSTDYEIDVVEQSDTDFVISYAQKVGDVLSTSGYSVIVHDNIVCKITDFTEQLPLAFLSSKVTIDENQEKINASNILYNNYPMVQIDNQKGIYLYDTETQTLSYVVYTDYTLNGISDIHVYMAEI